METIGRFWHIQGTKRKNIFILYIASNSFDSRVVGRYVVLVYIHNGFLQRLNTRIMVPSLSQVAYTINVCRLKEHNHLGVHLIRVFKWVRIIFLSKTEMWVGKNEMKNQGW